MAQRIRIQRIVILLLLFTFFIGAGSAETVFVDNFADLKTNLSSGGDKTVILTADISAEEPITVNGNILLTTEGNSKSTVSFADASASGSGFITIKEGAVLTIAGNRSGTITLVGKTSPATSLISVQSAELRMRNVLLKDNQAPDGIGGAISVNSGKIYLEGTTVTECSAEYGGAVYLMSEDKTPVDATFVNVAVTGCSADTGGAIYAENGKLTLSACSIVGCSAKYDGGGIYVDDSDLTLTNVNIADSMNYGYNSAILADSSTLTLSGAQDSLSEVWLDESYILLNNKFSTSDHIEVTLISDTAASSFVMKTDSGNIRDLVDYFTVTLPEGFITEANGKTLDLKAYVNFDANGASGYPFLADLKCAVPVELPICPYKREGYTFAGWALTANGAAAYPNAGTIALFKPTSLYAVWEKENENAAYVRTIANGGYVEFSADSVVRYINLPTGASGSLYLYHSAEAEIPEDMDAPSVFALAITEYPVGGISEIGFVLSESVPSSTDIQLCQYVNGEWKPLSTVSTEDGDTVIFEASTDSLGVFAVTVEDGGSFPVGTPLGVLGILAGLGAAFCISRK